jgi:flavorubredoxin
VYAATLANALKPKVKYAAVFGSYGWGGQTLDVIKNNMKNLKVEFLEPVLTKGFPLEEDFRKLDRMAEDIAARHREL